MRPALYWLSAALAVASGVGYHFSQKSLPQSTHPLLLLFPAYLLAIVITGVAVVASPLRTSLSASIKHPHWASLLLGISIVGIELGYLLMYKNGWKISMVPVVTNTLVLVILIPIGALVFKESVTLRQGIGIVLALMGIVLMSTGKPG
jgi:uncharacterized membrane protein